jgi:HEAT repeat protein
LEDFCSGEPQRQQSAAQLLGSLGHITLPLLGDIIKKEDDPRIRQLAASLLAERGAEAAKQLKRTLVTDSTPEERVRVLDVIDLVTKDLRSELAYLFRDENLQVRDSALRLAERLNNAEVERLLLECIEREKGDVAVGAIRCLGRLKRPGSSSRLVAVLKSTREEPNTIACCHALGQIADPVSIESLEDLLRPKGFLVWKKSYSDEIRASAAFALKEIDDPRVKDVLRRYAQDRDGRVREVALSVLASESNPPENEETDEG